MSFEIIRSNAFDDACAHREPHWIRITGNPTKRLKAMVVCNGVTYCGSTMRVHAFMIRICVWHSFRAHREIFWRCHNVAWIAVMTRRANRNLRKNGERNSEHKYRTADKNRPVYHAATIFFVVFLIVRA